MTKQYLQKLKNDIANAAIQFHHWTVGKFRKKDIANIGAEETARKMNKAIKLYLAAKPEPRRG